MSSKKSSALCFSLASPSHQVHLSVCFLNTKSPLKLSFCLLEFFSLAPLLLMWPQKTANAAEKADMCFRSLKFPTCHPSLVQSLKISLAFLTPKRYLLPGSSPVLRPHSESVNALREKKKLTVSSLEWFSSLKF